MQAVPSLVGTGTVVAAAAAGLVFAQPPEPEIPRPSSNKRKYAPDFDVTRMHHASSSPITRPATHTATPLEEFPYSSFRQFSDPVPSPLSSHPPPMMTASAQRPPLSVQVSSPKPTRRYSLIRPSEHGSGSTGEPRDSVSSRDSWIRRLSLRPMSQHGSPRSSMGPDSPSLTFSYASGAPILDPKAVTSQTKPNKLVKRTTSGHNGTPEGQSGRRGSRSQMPTLRRPATSHQRSATLQQFQQHQGSFPNPVPDIQFSLDRQIQPKELIRPLSEVIDPKQASGRWTSFFHARISRSSGRGSSARTSESSPHASPLPQRRISLRIGVASRAYLAKATQISGSGSQVPIDEIDIPYQKADVKEDSQDTSSPADSTDSTPSRRARRSISMHFSSPTNWISKTGSIRRPKRGSPEAKSSSPRHVSAPVEVTHDPNPPTDKPTLEEVSRPVEPQGHLEPELKPAAQIKSRQRNLSSPLPPLSRLSTFNMDVPRAGLSSSSSSTPPRPFPHPINYTSGSLAYSALPRSRGGSGERASTLAGSDGISGDDEDTDFKSDGMFDSFRTMASSNRPRTVETPLESMFDESPPSTAGNSKTKRLSIQEILGRSWDGDTKIMEEDESLQTPIRVAHLADPVEFTCRDRDDDDEYSFDATPDLSLGNRDFGRLSLDDDDDDDWARDDENTLSNHLSPPSSSTNSRRVSPTFRHVLINISGNDGGLRRDLGERPRSNIFDWCEPPNLDKFDDGQSLRPKTVHGKQELDLRGGRSVNRKGPSATHVRSQSVPVVPDPCDTSKPAPKFGTWGLGTKTASEDWDDDFDFDEGEGTAREPGCKDSATSFSMVVPASIQATQPTVKAHSGQIRELSLLVNDLKRLCRHGKDLDILHGVLHQKWKEAENIIALASPDEDSADETDSNEATMDFDRSKIDEQYLEEGFDGPMLDYPDDPFGTPEPEMGKTTVVRERQAVRRRSVFSPDDDIFGNSWPLAEESSRSLRPHTPDGTRSPSRNSAIIATVIEAMQQQQRQASGSVKSMAPSKPSDSKLFFDTNSLQELVKRASQLRDSLSDAVRRAELLTQSPAGTPRRERHVRHNHDGSPAFTRVFTDPAASPPKRLPKSHSTNSVLSKTSVDSPRMQMMIVN